MSYEVLILVFLILLFCFFSMFLTINVVLTLIKSSGSDNVTTIKLSELIGNRAKVPKKTKEQKDAERKYGIIMENLEAFDGTGIGQKEVK